MKGIERLQIPDILYEDGPQGFRVEDKFDVKGTSTAFTSLLRLGMTWDTELCYL